MGGRLGQNSTSREVSLADVPLSALQDDLAGGPAGSIPDDEPGEILYAFRDDLVIQQQGEQFIVKDPVKNAFGRLGGAEMLVAKQFDGSSKLSQIRERLLAEREVEVPMATLRKFRERLHGMQYILAPEEDVKAEDQALGGSRGFLSRLIIMPLPIKLNPDLFLAKLYAHLKQVFFRPAYPIFTVVAGIFAIEVWLDQWDRILLQAQTLGSIRSLITFWFVFAISVSCHEIAHGLTTKAFGGQVRRMGIFLYFFNVAFYTDVSEAWMFPSKLKQFLVIWAGAYTTFVLCIISTLLWRVTIPGTELNQIFFIFMSFNAFAAVFTLTPFLRGDGYYMTSCLLEIPNLREKSFEYARAFYRRLLFGREIVLPRASEREARIYVIYATLTFCFLLIFASLAITKVVGFLFGKLEAWGFVLVLIVLYERLGHRTGHAIVGGVRSLVQKPRRAAVSLAAIGAVIGVYLVPYPLTVSAPFEVVSLEPTAARTRVAGVVSEILVRPGQRVKRGEVVARLLDQDLLHERDRLAAEVREAEAANANRKKGYRREEIERARLAVAERAHALSQASRQLSRERRLMPSGATSAEEVTRRVTEEIVARKLLEQARQELKLRTSGSREEEIAQSEARLQAAKEALDRIEQSLRWSEIAAQIDGVVAASEMELRDRAGKLVKEGEEVVRIVDASKLYARIDVRESDLAEVALESPVELRLHHDPLAALSGTVDRMESAVASGAVPVLTSLARAGEGLRLGTTGVAKIQCGESTIGSVIVRRLRRTYLVRFWSWW
jgi:putative peptide zinc metalloprotease protein